MHAERSARDDGAGGESPLRRALVPLALAALALAVRALPVRAVLPEGGAFPFGADAFYHLRRIAYSVARFPASLDFDPYINFPAGARPIWTPTFDWCVALALRPFAGALAGGDLSGLLALERAAVWVPPVLGAATVVALYALARRHFDPAVATVSALVLALLSGHVWYSQIGFLDHHAAVALTGTLVLGAGMELVSRRGSGRPLRAGLVFAAALWVWPGSLAHVGLALAGAVAYVATRAGAAEARASARRLALCCAVAALAVLPFATQRWEVWSPLSPVVASAFQPWLFAAAALASGACAVLWRTRAARTRARRNLAGAVLALLVAGASLAALPELPAGAEEAWRWLAKREAFQAQVSESRPLLVEGGRVDPSVAARRLSLFVFVFPGAVALVAWWVRRERDRAPVLLLLGFACGLFALTLAQRRFFNSFSVPLALLLGWTACWLYRVRPPAWRGVRRRAVAAGLALGVGLQLAPGLATHRQDVRNLLMVRSGEPIQVSPHRMRQRRMLELARWLARHSPPTSGWLDARRRPEYGVLAPWNLGHVLEYGARRPTVTNQFGDDIGERNFRRTELYFLSEEAQGSALLDQLRVRFVVVARPQPFSGGRRPPPGSLYPSLVWYDGSERPTEPTPHPLPPIAALERHRLRYESPRPRAEPTGAAAFKVYEHVAGARLRGRAAAGAVVEAALALTTNRGRKLLWRSSTQSDASGRYELRLPYANRGGPPAVRPGARYELFCRGQRDAAVLTEAQVQGGLRVLGPDLCR